LTVYKRSVDLMEAELGDELVALDPRAGTCFGFNSVATSVWRLLEQPKTFEQLRQSLLDEYEVDPAECSQELQRLLGDMSSRGIVAPIA
jgi:hypothetical protein